MTKSNKLNSKNQTDKQVPVAGVLDTFSGCDAKPGKQKKLNPRERTTVS